MTNDRCPLDNSLLVFRQGSYGDKGLVLPAVRRCLRASFPGSVG